MFDQRQLFKNINLLSSMICNIDWDAEWAMYSMIPDAIIAGDQICFTLQE